MKRPSLSPPDRTLVPAPAAARAAPRAAGCGGAPASVDLRRALGNRACAALLQREPAAAAGTPATGDAARRIEALGGGTPLPPAERAFFEPRFGRDLGGVRVHTGADAAAAARAVGARAFALGTDVVLGAGAYAPGGAQGRRLLAHELAHVVQQSAPGAEPRIQRIPDESGINASPARYVFSTNCGWIDWGHATGAMPTRLIDAVRAASSSLASGPGGSGAVAAPAMESAPGGVVLSGVTPIATLKRALTSEDEILSVALRIFMLQSLAFEQTQEWTNLIGASSFSEEDLPSNIIGFYRGARGFDRSRIESLCDVWDAARTLARFQGHTFGINTTFRPPSLPAGGSWPADLDTIRPAEAGGALLDVPRARVERALSPDFEMSLGAMQGYEVIHSPRLHVEPLAGAGAIDISGTESSSAAGPHFEVRPLPAEHNLVFRWGIRDAQDNAYLMWGDSGSVQYYGPQFNAYIGSGTRALLRERGIRSATVRCRVVAGRGHTGKTERLLELPVTFTW